MDGKKESIRERGKGRMARKIQKAREDKDGWQERVKRRKRMRTDGKKESKRESDKDGWQERVKRLERIRTDGKKESKGERG